MYDPNSLMYVTKEYENSLKEKVKKISADDTVRATLDAVNDELDSILTQINSRLDEISNKHEEINTYRADIHRFIDTTSVNTKELIDENISSTTSFPSFLANKQNRSESRIYNYNNFINQKIELDSFDKVAINKGLPNSSDNVHSFDIKLSNKEFLKVVEFAITYKQTPTIIKKIEDSKITYAENTVTVNRIFTGRFYIMRSDVENEPEKIVVKAVIENADNLADNKETMVLDVRSMKDKDIVKYNNNVGPEFDLYFQVRSNELLTICIGNIIPYKWVMQKDSYITDRADEVKFTGLIVGNINKKFIDIKYSKIINGYLLRTENELFYTTDSNFAEENLKSITSINYINDNFWIKDVGALLFIHTGTRTYISSNDISNAILSNIYNINDIQQLSTSEIVASVSNKGLYSYNSVTQDFNNTPFITINAKKSLDDDEIEEDVTNGIDFLEIDENKLLVSSTNKGKLQYFFIVLNKNTNSYGDYATVSDIVSKDITNYSLANVTSTKVQLINTVIGVFNLVKVNGTSNNLSSIYNYRDLVVNSKSYTYTHNTLIKVYNQYENEEVSDLTNIIFDRIYDTSIGSFAITTDNQLYCFDDKYAIKAVTTRKITKASAEEGQEDTVLGYDDDKSFIKLDNSERYENTYFNKENPYLNNVLGIYENVSGIYVIDTNGVYELTSNFTFKTKYYHENSIVNYTTDTENTKKTIFIENNNNDKTDFYEISDIIKIDSDIKLRYKYTDLFIGKYTKYSDSIINYDYDTDNGNENPLIKFKANLYISLIDVTGSLYNTYSSANDIIKYSNTKYIYSDIDPLVTHPIEFTTNTTQEDGSVTKIGSTKNVETKEFILRTNDYGFLNYFNFNTENLTSDEISSINNKKIYKINHTSNDVDISFDDVRKQILKLMYKNNKKVSTAVGKTEYKYSNTGLNDKYPIRSFPLITDNSFKQVTWIDKIEGIIYLIGDNVLYKANTNGNSSINAKFVLTNITPTDTTNCSVKGFKQTTAGTFIWATEGIILWDFDTITTFTNQLTGYSNSTDGKILDVVDCKDARQTVLIVCEKTIYAVNCRPQAASKFAKPFSVAANIHKLSYNNLPSGAVMNEAFVCNGVVYIASYKSRFVLKMSYNDDNSIVLETLIANDTFNSLLNVDETLGIISIRYNNNNLLIQDNLGSIYRYNLTNNQISGILLKEELGDIYVNHCDVEDDDYLYYISNGLYRISKSDYTIECMDPEFKGILFQFYKERVYAISDVNGDDRFSGYPIITAIDLKKNYYYPISDSRNPNKTYINYDIFYSQNKMIFGDDNCIIYATVNPFTTANQWCLNQLFDMEHSYHNYDMLGINTQNTRGIKKIDGNYWYVGISNSNNSSFTGDLGIYNNPNNKIVDATYTEEVYNKTSDSTPNSNKTYYTLSGNFSEAFNITEFNPNTRYYTQNTNVLYVEVDKSVVTTPKRGVEYFTKNLDGVYVSCGYSFTQFSSNLNYYTKHYSYKLVTETAPIKGIRYFVCPSPVYTEETGLTTFISSTDYYEKSSSVYTYNTLADQIFSCKNKYLIYVLSTADSSRYLTFAYNIETKVKTILPFRIDRLWDTNVGVFIRYYKSSNVKNIGCLTDDLTTLVYDLDSNNITDGNGDLLEISSKETKTENDAQDIFICAKFGTSGKILKYAPRDTDQFNKFHEVLTNSLGYQRLFNVEDSVYCIETDGTLKIYKYDPDTNKFTINYTGREFNLCDVTYKIDETGKKDIYIIGSGDYNIYKSYNDTFKPIMTWWNNTIDRPTSVETTGDRIYITNYCGSSLSDSTAITSDKVIGNNSDEEFEFTNIGGAYDFKLPSYTDWYEDSDGNRFFIYRHICTYNLDNHKVGNPCYFNGTINTSVSSKYVLTDEANDEDVNGSHILDAKIKNVPITSYDGSHLIYPCYDTDINTLLPTGELQHLYDSDGITIKHEYPYFIPNWVHENVFIDSEYGTFGIHDNEVYLRKRYTENNARWTLIGNIKKNSSFKTIVKTEKLGWILVDEKSVTKFNPETMKFDIKITMATWTNNSTTNGAKINFVKEFTDSGSLFIGYEEGSNEFHNGVMRPFCLQYYCLVNNKYQFKNIDGITENWPCVGVYETSKGVFAVLEKIPTGKIIKNMSKSDYTNYENVVYKLDCGINYCTGTKINFMKSAPSGYTWKNISGALKPLDHNQIFETKLGDIFLAGQTFRRADTTYTNQMIIGYKLVNVSKEDPNDLLFVPLNNKTPSSYIKDLTFILNTDSSTRFYNGNYSDYYYRVTDYNTILVERNYKSDPFDYSNLNSGCAFYYYNFVNSTNNIKRGISKNPNVADGINANLLPIKTNTDGGTPANSIGKVFEFNENYYLLLTIPKEKKDNYVVTTVYKIDPSTETINYINNSEMLYKGFIYNLDYLNKDITWEMNIFNDQMFVKIFDTVYMFNSYKLTGIETTKSIVNDKVLYNLKLTIDNKSLYNNLSEKTSNSDIDKFVIKETGIVDLSSYSIDSNTNEVTLSGVNKNNINQYIIPHNFYNPNSISNTTYYKEYSDYDTLGKKILNIYNPSSRDTLINNRFLNKKNNDLLLDNTSHHTNVILGDIDKYIKNLSNFTIDLIIYPSSATNIIKDEPQLMSSI